MDEEKITSAEGQEIEHEEQLEQLLSKEEILERARNENDEKGDEREQKLLHKGLYVVLAAGLIGLAIVWLVNAIVLDRRSNELTAVVFIMQGIGLIWEGIFGKKNKKLNLSLGIIELICGITALVLWIISLVLAE